MTTTLDGITSAGDDDFLVGVAISVYQNSGGPGTNWEAFESMKNWLGRPYIEGGAKCGKSSDFWNNYEADIERVVSLNSNCFRLSLEWSRIEPKKGVWDQAGIKRYHEIFRCLQKHSLKTVVTLHHFVHPLWFEDLGAFETDASVQHFVDFVTFAFKEFGKYSTMWATFNEINVASFCGYLYGHFPPAKLGHFTLTGRHFLNMLKCHTAAYKAIKSLPSGNAVKVGLVHNYLRYEPRNPEGLSSYYISPVCKVLQGIWGNEIIIKYFREGVFEWKPPLGQSITYVEKEKPGLDWLGINYYGRVVLNWLFTPSCRASERMTDMPFPLYAPGLYDACKAMSVIGVPMYITETGVADHQDVLREDMMNTYFQEAERVVQDGFDLRGVMYWTLLDNFEWALAFTKKFGLYRWSPGDGHKRTEVPSTATLAKINQSFPSKIKELRQN